MRRLRILTWHVHGHYLWYLSNVPHEIYLPVGRGREGYGGKGESFPWPGNVHEIPAAEVRQTDFDVVITQSHQNWTVDQHDLLSPAHASVPRIHVEHDPPRESPVDTRHPVDDRDVLLVHVTHFNRLMWDTGNTPTRVIEHGVKVPAGARHTGHLNRGIVVVNSMQRRGRRAGADLFQRARRSVPLDLVGMESQALGGLGEVAPTELASFESRYRFFFHPARYTSLGLAVCEAMMIGMPVVGLATTELPTVIEDGVSGFVATDFDSLIDRMCDLLADAGLARRLGEQAAATARDRFGIERFVREWDIALRDVSGLSTFRRTQRSAPESAAAGTLVRSAAS